MTDLSAGMTTDVEILPFSYSKPECGLSAYSISGPGASIVNSNYVQFASNGEITHSFTLVVTAIGNTPATLTLATTIKIVDCSSGNIISGGSWNQNQVITDLSAGTTTDEEIVPFIYSKPECGLSAYSISGSGASIVNSNYAQFVSNGEITHSFSLVVTAIGNTPATLTLATTIKIVDCSNGNVISGGSWNQD